LRPWRLRRLPWYRLAARAEAREMVARRHGGCCRQSTSTARCVARPAAVRVDRLEGTDPWLGRAAPVMRMVALAAAAVTVTAVATLALVVVAIARLV
jgi:hypothetical protein